MTPSMKGESVSHFKTNDDLRRAIEQKIDRSVSDETWFMVEPDNAGPYNETDVREILTNLSPQQEWQQAPSVQSTQRSDTGSRTSKIMRKVFEHAMAESKKRFRDEAPYVASVRKQLFGNELPPCLDSNAMGEWIRRQAEIDGPATMHSEGSVTLEDGKVEPRRGWFDKLGWVGEDSWVEYVLVAEDKILDRLRQAVEYLAGHTGYHPAAAVNHLLTGKIPLIIPISGTVNFSMWGPYISLKVNYSWVPAEAVRFAYINALKDARSRWKILVAKRARSSPVAAKIKLFLDEHQDQDWWEVLRIWNEENPQHQYQHPRYLYRLKY